MKYKRRFAEILLFFCPLFFSLFLGNGSIDIASAHGPIKPVEYTGFLKTPGIGFQTLNRFEAAEVLANRDAIGAWETFTLVDLGNDQVALQANNGQYVVAEDGGGREVLANRDAIGAWETFTLVDLGNDQVALQANNGQYVVAEDGGGREVLANRDAIGAWETFTLVDLGNDQVALQANNGQYVVAEGGGGEDPSFVDMPFSSGSAYFRWMWSQIEPREGEYDWSLIDKHLARARKNGQTLEFRIMLENPGAYRIGIPQWLLDKVSNSGARFTTCEDFFPGDYYSPDLENPVIRKYHTELIKALGNRYDGHPDLGSVDIGSVGLWGEWHNCKPEFLPSVQEREFIIDLYYESFPNTPLITLVNDKERMEYAAKKGRSAWRGDCWGDYPGLHISSYRPAHKRIPDAWQKGPVALESCWTMEKWVFNWGAFTLVDLGNDQVALQANNGQYVVAEDGGGREVLANRDGIGAWESFTLVDLGNNQVALQANNGQYVVAEAGGGGEVLANRDAIGAWETFTLVEQPAGTPVALRASNGQYVVAEDGGGREVLANSDGIGAWESFTLVDLGNNQVALQANDGQYVVAEDGGGGEVLANRDAIGAWETFTLVDLGNDQVALQANNGQYVVAEGGGGGEVLANRDAIGAWEIFTLVEWPAGTPVALRASNGQYVVAEDGGGRDVLANRDGIGAWETFTLVDLGNDQVALQANNGQYVVAEDGGGREVLANRDGIGTWETFTLVDLGNDQVALQANNGQYVVAEDGGGREVLANRDAIGAWETFTLVDLAGTPVALRASNGQYVVAEDGGGREVLANRDSIEANAIKIIVDDAIDWHVSLAHNKSNYIPERFKSEVERLVMNLGFRLVLRKINFSHAVNTDTKMTISLEWENLGIAPPYRDHRIAFRLRDNDDRTHAESITDQSIRGWLPGMHSVEIPYVVPKELMHGQYKLELGLVFHNASDRIIPIADEGKTDDGWYVIGSIVIFNADAQVNDQVSLPDENVTTTYLPDDPRAEEGVFVITATFTNTSATTIKNPFFGVVALSGNNQLINADGGPGGVGATLTANAGDDHLLSPGESMTTTFEIALEEKKRFTFFVDLFEGSSP